MCIVGGKYQKDLVERSTDGVEKVTLKLKIIETRIHLV